ncbi:uncharacterized protein BX663DRAFT_543971 [Cokeromyces recurvatus]|uniref:uncharacterized protein n=1 Tax=Cokeromyces recurvatus TaxID=90255 RepID=UPI00222000EC|nr:uncharacterized protein BX663DRAFT_543971 [Cokeromyces recurvatus]KAI7901622.1 hypothetical protein BX663DRAFT_543971 [Cokeromyces recurvatus]
MTITSPHAETARNALARLKRLAGESSDEWKYIQEKNNVKLYHKSEGDSPFVIVRGDTLLKGHEFTAAQVASVATLPGCRAIWDEKFDTSDIKKMYNKYESLFWSKVKTPWPISPRDMSATSLREMSDDECYVVMTSVEDEAIPPVSNCVRSNLLISGWKIIKTEAGIAITYITQIDLAGSIPTAFMKNVQQQVALCAGTVVQYITKYGFPPLTKECSAEFKREEFEHAEREYSANLDGSGECQWLVSSKMFSKVKVHIMGSDHATFEISTDDKGNKIVDVKGIDGPTTVKISNA